MPPLFRFWSFPSWNGVEADSGSSSEESDEEIEEEEEEEFLFSDHRERSVYQEYLQSISQEYGEEDLPEGVMSVSLFKHERVALDWMLFRENSSHCAGGILADEQGLGKTIVVIALILKGIDQQSKFMSADSDRAAVVMGKMNEPLKMLGATTSLLEVLRQESARGSTDIKLFVEDRIPSSPSILRYRVKPAGGTLVVCPSSILTQWDEEICKVAKDFGLSVFVYHGCSRTEDPEELAKHGVVLTSYGMVKRQFTSKNKGSANGPIAWVRWWRIVLDEAHVIRNLTSQVARACWKLEAERRWCITGTPMQNRIDDLYSYLRFLRYEPYSKYSSFCSLLKDHNSMGMSLGRNKLEIFLGTVLLRRTKETLINGEPIIKLLPKTIQTRKILFTEVEHEFYLTLDKDCQRMWMDAITESESTIESSSSESAPEKVLVFSQFTRMLDLLEPLLNSSHIQFRRFDGNMTRQVRDKAVKSFNKNPKSAACALMAGNVGLNLTAASHVIIVDPWWNPFVEDQAIGRAHRIGQTRPVTVYHLVVQGMIEERVLYLLDQKRRMVERAFGGDIFGVHATDALTEEELRYLFASHAAESSAQLTEE